MKFLLKIFVFVFLLADCAPPRPRIIVIQMDDEASEGKGGERQPERSWDKPCLESKVCEETCDDIYKDPEGKIQCIEKLSVKRVEFLWGIYEILKNPALEDLNGIHPEDLRVFLNVSLEPFITLAGRMTQLSAKTALRWLVEGRLFAEVIHNEDYDFEVLKALLAPIHTDTIQALNTPLYKGRSFLDMAADKNNRPALSWVHDFFDDICRRADTYIQCMFTDYYCLLELKPKTESFYFNWPPFYELLEKVLEDARPDSLSAGHWWKKGMDTDDLDRWKGDPNNICGLAEF